MEEVSTADNRLQIALENHEFDLRDKIAELESIKSKLKERNDALNKKKLDIIQLHGKVDAADDDFITINAGGKSIDTKRSTLTQLKGTRLEKL